MPTPPTTAAELLELLRKSGVASPQRLADASRLSLPAEPQNAAAALVSGGIITRFQAQQLLAGRHKGFRLGSYAILDLLGRGGMGAVYLAEHLTLHRKVALKVLIPGKNEDQKTAVEAFQREARAVAALDHPNIVRIFDVASHNDTPFLVMEYVEGDSLQQVLERSGPIPYAAAAEYIAQVAAGLQHAHERGFIHRDIKPANLMREKHGVVKILDLGLAHTTAEKGSENREGTEVAGTAEYIAPEQGMNLSVDSRADIYSLGGTLFALIAGKPPFEGTTTQLLLQHQLKTPPTLTSLNSSVPAELSAVVAKMLQKKPDDRYQTPAEVVAALAPWMGNSSRVIAGLSRTNIVQRSTLQATLAEIARGSGSSVRRHSGSDVVALAELTEVDTSAAGQETGSVSNANTASGPSSRPARPQKRRRLFTKQRIIYAAIGVVALVAGVFAGWLAFAR
ncbi:MAG: serine/threonine protein kinase [Planctomycetaceae bacterium]|nr:serine/threonine protein kinase [Planctomycetaceae bacterium]